jgi:hypothetical protein
MTLNHINKDKVCEWTHPRSFLARCTNDNSLRIAFEELQTHSLSSVCSSILSYSYHGCETLVFKITEELGWGDGILQLKFFGVHHSPPFLGFCFLVDLESELRASHIKQALYHLIHPSSPFCFGYFGDRVFQTICLGWPSS